MKIPDFFGRSDHERRSSGIPGYILQGRLGKGALATVYKARNISSDRIVAIKVLPPRLMYDAGFVERFYRQGKAAARLSHENLVNVIAVASTPDNLLYYVMEYVEGKTLYDVMLPLPAGGRRSIFSEAEVVSSTRQIASALARAHKRNLIHGNVIPRNILITQEGAVKLTDLGLARPLSDDEFAQSELGMARGIPYYNSPEQIRGAKDLDHRTDIYSLGATMYHLVTGRPAFEGNSASEVMQKHLNEALFSPNQINVTVSRKFSDIITKSMSKDPSDRYDSMEGLLEDLQLA